MTRTDNSPGPCLEQVYLMDSDAGLLCRILGLYAARGMDVLSARYTYAAQGVMRLDVRVPLDEADGPERVRILVEKATSFVGVLAAEVLHADLRTTLHAA